MDSTRIWRDLMALCQIPSISGSLGERHFPKELMELLLQIPYFQKNPDHVSLYSTEGESTHYLFALMRSPTATEKTILLLSHFDVVGVEEYGTCRELAFQPEKYTDFLKQGGLSLPADAKEDLESGNFIFGRGICDMKWGIAADLELLRYFSAYPSELKANLLLVCVPDEERNSSGMLSAVRQLVKYREKHCLHFASCVVSEPDISCESAEKKHIYVGAAGKLMPSFYCVGKETHVGQPFCGLNPNLLLSSVTAHMELAPEFIDRRDSYFTPAPSCLKQSDTKTGYSVQTPCAAYGYFNIITLQNTPQQVIKLMEQAAHGAFRDVLQTLEERHRAAEEKSGRKLERSIFSPKVLRYDQLWELCEKAHGENFRKHMEDFLKNAPDIDLRDLTVRTVREAHSFCPDRDPMIILFFCPPYYPHSGFPPEDSETVRACRRLIQAAPEEGFSLDWSFNGLTDMSYLSLREPVDLKALKNSFPIWGERYSVPLEEIRALDIPFINFGPLGKDAHKYTERLDLSFSFGRAPKLLLQLVKNLF